MRTIIVALYLVLFLVLTIPLMLFEWILGFINPHARDVSSLAIVQWGFRCITFLTGAKVTCTGLEKVPADRPVLYVLNHRSIFDIVLTYTRVPRPTGFIAKKELRKVPLLNIWIYFVHTLFLDRENVREGMKTILKAIDNVKNGISILICPEGTRNKTEEPLQEVKGASFKIATKTGCPVVPVTLVNTENMFEAHFPWIKAVPVIIEYGDPIYLENLSKDEIKDIHQTAENIVRETYIRNRAALDEQLAAKKK